MTDSTAVNLDTGNGNDQVAIDSIESPVTITAGNGQDTFDIGSLAGLWPNSPSNVPQLLNINGVVGQIAATLVIQGGTGGDMLNVDDTGDSATTSGTLTSSELSGLGMAGQIDYSSMAELNLNLGSGAVTFTVASTESGTTTNVQGGDGGDTINVQTVAGPTNVGLGTEDNTVNVGSMAGVGGYDFNGVLSGITAALTVNGQPLAAQFTYPAATEPSEPATIPSSAEFDLPRTRAAITSVTVGGVLIPTADYTLSGRVLTVSPPQALLGGNAPLIVVVAYTIASPAFDNLVVDDSADNTGRSGTLTSSTILGLGMSSSGIVYNNIAALYLQLGLGDDTFYVASTHLGTTNINGGPGNDTFNVNSVEGGTEIQGYDPAVPATETFTGLSGANFVQVYPMLDSATRSRSDQRRSTAHLRHRLHVRPRHTAHRFHGARVAARSHGHRGSDVQRRSGRLCPHHSADRGRPRRYLQYQRERLGQESGINGVGVSWRSTRNRAPTRSTRT